MVRIVFFLILTGLAVTAAVTLAGFPGLVRVEWLGRIVELPIGVGIAGLLSVALLGAIAFWLFRAIWRTPKAVGEALGRRRTNKGYQAVSAGMLAVAAGDAGEAKRQARKAEQLLANLPLARLLSAQAAQLGGDEGAAKQYFEAMLDDRQTEFLGVRGLLTLAAKEGDRPNTLRLSKRAMALKPTSPWAQIAGLEAAVNSHLWLEAQGTLARATSTGTIGKEDAAKLRAALLVERSRVALGDGEPAEALSLATQARKLDPSSRPAALWLAKRQIEAGKARAARNTIEKAWATVPGAQLAALHAELGPEGEKPNRFLSRVQRLAGQNPDHVESLLALAQAQMVAEKWEAARENLLRVEAVEPTRRVYRLLADLERQAGDPILVDGWLNKADRAADDRPETTFEPSTAPARVWAAAPGWRGQEVGVSEEDAPSPGTDVAIGYEGKVPKLPPAAQAAATAVAVAPPETVTGDLSGQTEPASQPAETTILPPAAKMAEPAAQPITLEPDAPKPKTNGAAANGSAGKAETILANVPDPSVTADPEPAAEPEPAPVAKTEQPVAEPETAQTEAAQPSGTTNRDWLSRPSRSIGGSIGKTEPQERSWLTKPSRSI
ncbi:MAG: heme biosynthesis HemY N-terminal domain-containing protein [Pseudomonadota bacterium]